MPDADAPYDIALVKMATPVTLNDYINVACLPDENTVTNGQLCYVSGWGIKTSGEKQSLYYNSVQ